jgi:hypothetical protein
MRKREGLNKTDGGDKAPGGALDDTTGGADDTTGGAGAADGAADTDPAAEDMVGCKWEGKDKSREGKMPKTMQNQGGIAPETLSVVRKRRWWKGEKDSQWGLVR